VRLVAWLAALAACDQGAPAPAPAPPRWHTQSRRSMQLDDPLPDHGITLHRHDGLGGDRLVVIDSDAKTLRDGPNATTRALGDAEVARFATLADAAWREPPGGETTNTSEIHSELAIGDGDDVFFMYGTPWPAATGRLVDAIDDASRLVNKH
jgi:hypothetical protein